MVTEKNSDAPTAMAAPWSAARTHASARPRCVALSATSGHSGVTIHALHRLVDANTDHLVPLPPPRWPWNHEVPLVELRRACRSCAPYLPERVEPAEVSQQFLTTMA
jgi:hypothetical protein